MRCDDHYFHINPHCWRCRHIAGGFYGGFMSKLAVWRKGAQSLARQGGILPSSDSPEHEDNRLLVREGRLIWRLSTRRNLTTARWAWHLLPSRTRYRLYEAGFERLGHVAGAAAATRLFLFAGGFVLSTLVMAAPQLRALMVLRRPLFYSAQLILTMLSAQHFRDQLVARHRRIFLQYPGSEPIYRDFLDKMTREKDRDDEA